MFFQYDAYPMGLRGDEFTVCFTEDQNVSAEEHRRNLDAAAEEVKRKFQLSTNGQRLEAAILYSCHVEPPVISQQPVNPRSVIL